MDIPIVRKRKNSISSFIVSKKGGKCYGKFMQSTHQHRQTKVMNLCTLYAKGVASFYSKLLWKFKSFFFFYSSIHTSKIFIFYEYFMFLCNTFFFLSLVDVSFPIYWYFLVRLCVLHIWISLCMCVAIHIFRFLWLFVVGGLNINKYF
jgi:hypothetical protein